MPLAPRLPQCDAVFNLHIWQPGWYTWHFFGKTMYLHHTSHLILDHAALNPSENYWSSYIAYILPYFFGCEQHRFACSVLGQKKTFSLNGGDLMVIPSHGWNHEVDGSVGPLPDSTNQPFFNGEKPPTCSDTTLPYRGTTLPYRRLGSARIAAAWHPWSTWRPGCFFFLVVCKKPRRWWWLPQVENFQNGISLSSFFTFWCHVEVWCWT